MGEIQLHAGYGVLFTAEIEVIIMYISYTKCVYEDTQD